VQSKILKAYPHARLRVFAIWVSKLFGVARRRWDAAGLSDPRVVHLWDPDDVAGGWLAANVAGYQGGDWDTYLLFGPDASWTGRPAPLASSGGPVDHQMDELRRALRALPTS